MWARIILTLITDERWLLRRHLLLDHHRLLLRLLLLVLYDNRILKAHIDRLMHGLLHHLLLLLFHGTQILAANFSTSDFIYLIDLTLVVHEHVGRLRDLTTAHAPLYTVVVL